MVRLSTTRRSPTAQLSPRTDDDLESLTGISHLPVFSPALVPRALDSPSARLSIAASQGWTLIRFNRRFGERVARKMARRRPVPVETFVELLTELEEIFRHAMETLGIVRAHLGAEADTVAAPDSAPVFLESFPLTLVIATLIFSRYFSEWRRFMSPKKGAASDDQVVVTTGQVSGRLTVLLVENLLYITQKLETRRVKAGLEVVQILSPFSSLIQSIGVRRVSVFAH